MQSPADKKMVHTSLTFETRPHCMLWAHVHASSQPTKWSLNSIIEQSRSSLSDQQRLSCSTVAQRAMHSSPSIQQCSTIFLLDSPHPCPDPRTCTHADQDKNLFSLFVCLFHNSYLPMACTLILGGNEDQNSSMLASLRPAIRVQLLLTLEPRFFMNFYTQISSRR